MIRTFRSDEVLSIPVFFVFVEGKRLLNVEIMKELFDDGVKKLVKSKKFDGKL